jgi:hypothetical protein
MITDNRNLPPLRTDIINGHLAIWVYLANGARVLPLSLPPEFHGKKMKYGVAVNFIKNNPTNRMPLAWSDHKNKDIAVKNHELHLPLLRGCNTKFKRAKTVILCGAGNSLAESVVDVERYRNEPDTIVVTVSRAQELIEGDYWVGLEPVPHKVGGKKSNTIAHLLSVVHHGIAQYDWKRVTWGSNRFLYGGDNIPVYHPHETVSCMAFEFACKVLMAKKIILVGMDHPIQYNGSSNYFWHGIELQAMTWYAAHHINGINTWNCTPVSSVIAGVIIGGIDEAFLTEQ